MFTSSTSGKDVASLATSEFSKSVAKTIIYLLCCLLHLSLKGRLLLYFMQFDLLLAMRTCDC